MAVRQSRAPSRGLAALASLSPLRACPCRGRCMSLARAHAKSKRQLSSSRRLLLLCVSWCAPVMCLRASITHTHSERALQYPLHLLAVGVQKPGRLSFYLEEPLHSPSRPSPHGDHETTHVTCAPGGGRRAADESLRSTVSGVATFSTAPCALTLSALCTCTAGCKGLGFLNPLSRPLWTS